MDTVRLMSLFLNYCSNTYWNSPYTFFACAFIKSSMKISVLMLPRNFISLSDLFVLSLRLLQSLRNENEDKTKTHD